MEGEDKKRYGAIKDVAPATESGYTIACTRFNEFASQQHCKTMENFSAKDFLDRDGDKQPLAMELAKEYATYLMMYKKNDGSHLKPGTAVQYLSGWKSALSRKFPKVTMLKEKHHDSLWYDDLYVSDNKYYFMIH